jgi:hypothetical protein
MTRSQAVGVLVGLGLLYAGLYVAWWRRRPQHASRAAAVDSGMRETSGDTGPALITGSRGEDSDREPGIQVATGHPTAHQGPDGDYDVRAEGTYIATTTAVSRQERAAVEGLQNSTEAVLLIHRGDAAHLVEIQRAGEPDVFITADRLKAFRRDRSEAGRSIGAPRLGVLTWRADDGSLYETAFLPRHRADLERIEAALWWHTAAREVQEPVHTSEPGLTADYTDGFGPMAAASRRGADERPSGQPEREATDRGTPAEPSGGEANAEGAGTDAAEDAGPGVPDDDASTDGEAEGAAADGEAEGAAADGEAEGAATDGESDEAATDGQAPEAPADPHRAPSRAEGGDTA